MNMQELSNRLSQNTSSGKTCRVHFHLAKVGTSKKSYVLSQATTESNLNVGEPQDISKDATDSTMSPIGFSIRGISECPNGGVKSFLSEVLETTVAPKYYLSRRACEGIIRRAKVRQKILPPLLRDALEDTLK